VLVDPIVQRISHGGPMMATEIFSGDGGGGDGWFRRWRKCTEGLRVGGDWKRVKKVAMDNVDGDGTRAIVGKILI
ncbi:hypothetical protein U1Q18_007664, partial [Sarracenia purpurea var. burkii]